MSFRKILSWSDMTARRSCEGIRSVKRPAPKVNILLGNTDISNKSLVYVSSPVDRVVASVFTPSHQPHGFLIGAFLETGNSPTGCGVSGRWGTEFGMWCVQKRII